MLKISLLLLSFVSTPGAASEQPSAESKPPLIQVSYGAVTALNYAPADKVLSYGNSAQQFIEGWFPAKQHIADIVFIHGGCWLSAYDIEHSRALTAALRDAGYRVWSLEYRRTGDDNTEDEGGWPETYEDIEAALAMLTQQNKINPAHTVLMGHSAGGHLALLAAQEHPEYAGVVGLAAIADVVAYAKGDNSCQSVTEQFMGGTPDILSEKYKKANPKAHPMHTSTYLIYSEHDNIVPAAQANGLQKVTKLQVDNAGHFDFIHPGSTAFPVILDAITQALK